MKVADTILSLNDRVVISARGVAIGITCNRNKRLRVGTIIRFSRVGLPVVHWDGNSKKTQEIIAATFLERAP